MIDFLKTVFVENWIGCLIGLGISLILLLILSLTVFKESKVGKVIMCIMIIPFVFCGAFIQNSFFTKYKQYDYDNDDVKNSAITRLDPNKVLTIKSNCGFDRSYILEHRDEWEVGQDEFFDLNCVEYKDIVVFYYDKVVNDKIYTMNSVFIKTDSGLVFDGCFNMNLKATKVGGMLWWTNYYFEYQNEGMSVNHTNFVNIKNPLERGSVGYCYCLYQGYLPQRYFTDNLEYKNILKSDYPFFDTTSYRQDIAMLCRWTVSHNIGGDEITEGYKVAQNGNLKVFNNNFQQFDNIGIMLENGKCFDWQNRFFTAIYKNLSGSNKGCFEVSDYCAVVKEGSGNAVGYNSKCYVNLNKKDMTNYSVFSSKLIDSKNKSAIDDTDVLVGSTMEKLIKFDFKFNNKDNSDLTKLDLKKYPVGLKILQNGIVFKTYLLEDKTSLFNNFSCSLKKGEYDLEIVSSALKIGSSSKITINEETSIIQIDYSYTPAISLSLKLSPVSNVDISDVDFSKSPVEITVFNDKASYKFTFDTLEKVNNVLSVELPVGEFQFVVTSEKLTFSELFGDLKITSESSELIFNYDYKTIKEYSYSLVEGTANQGCAVILPDLLYTKAQYVNLYIIDSGTVYKHKIIITYNSGFCTETEIDFISGATIYFEIYLSNNTTIHTNSITHYYTLKNPIFTIYEIN